MEMMSYKILYVIKKEIVTDRQFSQSIIIIRYLGITCLNKNAVKITNNLKTY